jgi:hypothetical protein
MNRIIEDTMNYIITGKGYVSELIKQVDRDVKIISEDEFKNSNLMIKTGDKVYAPTESALEIILERTEDTTFTNAVNLLKDKHKFRELMSNMYPDFFFAKTTIDELEKIELDRDKKYIIKPTKGFFGTAVKELNKDTEISEIAKEIRKELEENSRYFSESILSKNELIIEQFVEGEEYAVDMYFNENGQPEILNIYHHPLPERNEYFHVLYYTNKDIFDRLYDRLNAIFIELNYHLKINNFPIHAEFKLENDKLIPIEMNPLRFGGFGLADLAYHAFGFNPFNAFFSNFKPNWQEIWDERNEHHFGWVLGYNGTDIDVETHTPDDEAYLRYLGDTLHYVEIDHKENPVFSIAYVKDNCSTSLQCFLKTEFNDFFVPIKS